MKKLLLPTILFASSLALTGCGESQTVEQACQKINEGMAEYKEVSNNAADWYGPDEVMELPDEEMNQVLKDITKSIKNKEVKKVWEPYANVAEKSNTLMGNLFRNPEDAEVPNSTALMQEFLETETALTETCTNLNYDNLVYDENGNMNLNF